MCSVYIYVYKSSIDFICVSLVYNHIDREREQQTVSEAHALYVKSRASKTFSGPATCIDVLRQAAP